MSKHRIMIPFPISISDVDFNKCGACYWVGINSDSGHYFCKLFSKSLEPV